MAIVRLRTVAAAYSGLEITHVDIDEFLTLFKRFETIRFENRQRWACTAVSVLNPSKPSCNYSKRS